MTDPSCPRCGQPALFPGPPVLCRVCQDVVDDERREFQADPSRWAVDCNPEFGPMP